MIYRTMPKGSKCQRWKYWNTRESAVGYAKALAEENKCIYVVERMREGKIEQRSYYFTIPTIKNRKEIAMSEKQTIYLEQTGEDTFRITRVRNSMGFKVGLELQREQVKLMQEQGYDIDIREARTQGE